MDFELSKQQCELQERVHHALAEVVVPVVRCAGPGARLGAEEMKTIYRGLAPLGYLGSTISKDEGGAGMSHVDYGLLLKALAHGPVVLTEVVPARAIAYLGTKEQKARWLSKLLSGDCICCGGVTEPQAGSDLRNLQMTALPEGDSLMVQGRKKWIHLGGIADMVNVVAITDPEKGTRGGTSRVILERDQSCWEAMEIDCVGMRNLSFAELRFERVRVPRENVLSPTADGMAAFKRAVESSRAWLGLLATGIAEAALADAHSYVKERFAFGRSIGRFQAIQTALADAAAEIEAASLIALKALWQLDQGRSDSRTISMAKVLGTEAAVRACDTAMRCMGAFGLSVEAGVERRWRDARMLTVMDGTSDIQRLIIGREILGVHAFF